MKEFFKLKISDYLYVEDFVFNQIDEKSVIYSELESTSLLLHFRIRDLLCDTIHNSISKK